MHCKLKLILLSFLLNSQLNAATTELAPIQFEIKQGKASDALLYFAEQADLSFGFALSLLKGVQTNSVNGFYPVDIALSMLFDGTGMQASVVNNRILLTPPESTLNTDNSSDISNTKQSEHSVRYVENEIEVINVKGFRRSLNQALLNKKASINITESITAEDMGKFPDLNIAESLQRLPGVAITRESGEGRRITLRGLGPDFTRVTLNGMEIPSTTDELDSSVSELNGGRAFEFNIFASELFNRVDIQKSPTPSMEEGGIAGTVNLYSAKPFEHKGFKLAASVQSSYNPVSESNDPRGAFLISDTFKNNTYGALFSFAYSKRTVHQEGFGTVGWQTPVENNMLYADTEQVVMTGMPASEDCQLNHIQVHPVNCLWVPRLPRPDFFGNNQDRFGVTTTLQYAPNKNVELTFDFLHSELKNDRSFYNYYQMYRNYFSQITPLEIKINENGKQVDAGLFDGLTGRIESRKTLGTTQFNQLAVGWSWQAKPDIEIDGMVGLARSDFRREELRHIMDTKNTHKFEYDFSNNANAPHVNYFYNFNDPAEYDIKSFDGADGIEKQNLTAKLDFTYTHDDLTLKTGFAYNDRRFITQQFALPDFSLASAIGLTRAFPKADFGKDFNGNTFPFIVADFDKVKSVRAPLIWYELTQFNSTIIEKTQAAYLEIESQFDLNSTYLTANFGVRAIQTDTFSKGFVETDGADVPVKANHDYDNFLPALNLALEASDNIIVRLGLARSMTRPSLTKLNPGNPGLRYIEGFITVGNPYLNPYQTSNLDLGFEWYFKPESLISANFFYKDIDTYIRTAQEEKRIDPIYYAAINQDPNFDASVSVDPFNQAYTHISSVNGMGTDINGIELSYQQPFSFLPGKLKHTGIIANYTQVHSGENVGVSKNSHNLTLYYEEPGMGARISMNSRGDYYTEVPGYTGNAQNATSGPTYVDFSSFYKLNKNITLSFEVGNLTDEYAHLYVTGDGSMNLMREYNHTGRQFIVGIRYNQ